MKNRLLKFASIIIAVMSLFVMNFNIIASAESDRQAVTTISQANDEKNDKENAKGDKAKKIVVFLIIFTISGGITAFLVIRPSLKKLKK